MIRFNRGRVRGVLSTLHEFFLGDELVDEHRLTLRETVPIDRIHEVVWKSCDALFRVVSGIKPLSKGESHLFCIAHHRYLGRPFLVDGIPVRRFDPVIEIHMNNRALSEAIREQRSVVSLATRLIKETKRSLPPLATSAASHKNRKAQILYGVTFIHRGVERFGFETYPILNQPAHGFLTWYLRNIFRITNPNARSLLQSRPDVFVPKIVAISKQRLMQEYGGLYTPTYSKVRA